MDITKNIWKGGKQEMKKLITYVKAIELFEGIRRRNKKKTQYTVEIIKVRKLNSIENDQR
jgi:hypothetical protein